MVINQINFDFCTVLMNKQDYIYESRKTHGLYLKLKILIFMMRLITYLYWALARHTKPLLESEIL